MKAWGDAGAMTDELLARIAALEERVDRHHGPTLLDHGAKLDKHDRQLSALQAAHVELRHEMRTLSVQVGRLSDVATAQGLSLEKIDRNVQRLLEILEPRTVVVGE